MDMCAENIRRVSEKRTNRRLACLETGEIRIGTVFATRDSRKEET